MQNAIVFFVGVIVILVIAFKKPVEGFTSLLGLTIQSKNEGTPENCNSRLSSKQSALPVASLGVGNIQPSPAPPSDLPSAPVGFHSKETPNPYRNPTLEPARYIRLVGVKEDLQAFFGFEAQSLEDRSDPSIQIPLTRARADLTELVNVQSVMERNPGLQSRITTKQLNDIQSNLDYLRQLLRDLEANNLTKTEGFKNMRKGKHGGHKNILKYDRRATLSELQAFQIKVVVEIKRLSASGTSDPLVKARIGTLQNIKNDIDDVITKIEEGVYTPTTVPIYKSDIDKSLPILGRQDKPLPQLLNKFSLPPAIASLFPNGLSPKDNEQASQINNIVKGYMKNVFEGTSWGVDLNIKYKPSKKKKELDNPYEKAYGLPGTHSKNTSRSSSKRSTPKRSSSKRSSSKRSSSKRSSSKRSTPKRSSSKRSTPKRSSSCRTKSQTQIKKPGYVTDKGCTPGLPGVSNRVYPDPVSGGLNWEKRSKQILSQVRKRGLDPLQFGAIPSDAIVSDEFSWRGYTRMLCMRLSATTDPGLSVTVGCPAEDWPGWKL